MKTITNSLAFALLALVGSSCQNNQQAQNTEGTDPGYQEYGYYASDSGPQQSSNPFATDSSYGSYQQSASRDTDYVNVTPTSPAPAPAPAPSPYASGSSSQMPSSQGSITPLPPSNPAPSFGHTTAASNSHVVAQGETLYRISKMYGSTVEGIKSVNGLHSNLIHPGDVLSIP